MKKLLFKLLFPIFICLLLAAIFLIVAASLGWFSLKIGDGVTVFAALLAFAIVWWQGHLIKQQMQLSAMLDLDREWNSKEMRHKRAAAWNEDNLANRTTIENVLEFLEKVSTFEREGVISYQLIWATFGWYVWRYYYYCKDTITDLQKKWAPDHPDKTLYEDFTELYDRLLSEDKRRRRLSKDELEKELEKTREIFVRSERDIDR